ncbi:MAG: 30S ribosomal protein S15 [Dehalococcoidia bacterium]
MIEKEQKQSIMEKTRVHEKDTGSPEVQIGILTERISELTEHMRQHKHDYHSQRGLMKLVEQRRRLMRYLRRYNSESYKELVNKLNLRG